MTLYTFTCDRKGRWVREHVLENEELGGTRVAHSVKHLTLDFDSGCDLKVVGLSPPINPCSGGISACTSPSAAHVYTHAGLLSHK